jgi:hypothetical protein
MDASENNSKQFISDTSSASASTETKVGAAADAALCLWFLLVIAAFWGPYVGFLAPGVTTALYGAFLLGAVTVLALRVLRAREAARGQATAAIPPMSKNAERRNSRGR